MREQGAGAGRGLRSRWRAALAAASLAALVTGCREGGGTGPEEEPARLERVSPESDEVPVGEILERPLRVRVTGASGDRLSGVSVRFRILSGPGTLGSGASQVTVPSTTDGTASAVFTGGAVVGTASIRTDIPSAPLVLPVEFSIRTTGAISIDLAEVSGSGQQAEVGSQLPRPFVVRATRTQGGSPAGGIRVDWLLEPGAPAGTRLSTEFAFTATDGTARVLLTLGSQATDYLVRAASPGQPDTVAFTAAASGGPGGTVVLDSVSPRPLRPGVQATLYGIGFNPAAGGNEVRVEGEAATVVSSTAATITFVTPGFAGQCLPARTVGVRAIVGSEHSNGLIVDLGHGGAALDLSLGERRIASGADARCLQFRAAAAGRGFRLAVQSASTSPFAFTPMRLVVRAGDESGAGPVTHIGERISLAAEAAAAFASAAELRMRRSALDALLAAGARPALDRSAEGAFALSVAPPTVGQRLQIRLAVSPDLTVSCQTVSATISAVVRAVGDHFAIVEDEANPSSFSAADLAELRDEFDGVVFPVDSGYFGGPADIDGNQRVLVLFTREVNELTPRGSGTFIGGFFVPTDLAADGQAGGGGFGGDGVCFTSNEAELLYVLAPDPDGVAGDEVSTEFAKENARNVTSHEFQHLLSAEQRIFRQNGGFADLEDTWLAEGLAHLAEEVVGLRAAGLEERENVAAQALADVDVFNGFHINNFARLRRYFRAPNETLALSLFDPGGFESLEMRGFAWIFARWLGDHFGPATPPGPLGGSGEAALFRELSSGGPSRSRGIPNVLRAVEVTGGGQRTWAELLGQFAIMPAVDDLGVPNVPPASTLATWDLPGVFRLLHTNPGSGPAFPEEYPLAITARDLSSGSLDFELLASTEVFLELEEGPAPAFSLELASPSGGAVPQAASPQLTVIRVF